MICFRRETLSVPVARVRVEVREVGRTDPPLPKAYWRETLQVRRLRKVVRKVGSLSATHEATPAQNRKIARVLYLDFSIPIRDNIKEYMTRSKLLKHLRKR